LIDKQRSIASFVNTFCTDRSLPAPFDSNGANNVVDVLGDCEVLFHILRLFPDVDIPDDANITFFLNWLRDSTFDAVRDEDFPAATSFLTADEAYPQVVDFLTHFLTFVHTSSPHIFPALPAASKAELNDAELILLTSVFGADALYEIPDVGKDLDADPSIFETGEFWLYFSATLSLTGLSMVLVAQPALVRSLSDSSLVNGILLGIFNLVQLFAAPLWGRASDTIGRKNVFAAAMALYALFYYAQGFFVEEATGDDAHDWAQLLKLTVWRSLSGIAGIIVPFGNAILTDMTPAKRRTRGVGYLYGCTALGYVVGPFLVAYLKTQMGFHWKGLNVVSATISLIGSIFVLIFLPETSPVRLLRRVGDQTKSRVSGANFKHSWAVVKKNASLQKFMIGYFLGMFLIAGLNGLNYPVFSGWFVEGFQADVTEPTNMSAIIAAVVASGITPGTAAFAAAVGAEVVSQITDKVTVFMSVNASVDAFSLFFGSVFLLPPFLTRFGELNATHVGNALGLLCSLVIGFLPVTSKAAILYCAFTNLANLGNGWLHSSYVSLCTQFSEPRDRGALVNLAQIGNSLGRFAGPIISGLLYDIFYPSSATSDDNIRYVTFLLVAIAPIAAIIVTLSAKPPTFLSNALTYSHPVKAEKNRRKGTPVTQMTPVHTLAGDVTEIA
jgi:MFS family permease